MTHLADRHEQAVGLDVNVTNRTDRTTPLDRDLLERVIQRIFTAGILLRTETDDATAIGSAKIEAAIVELDETLRDIRREVLHGAAVLGWGDVRNFDVEVD